MTAFLFRNRWITLAWVLMLAVGAAIIVPALQRATSAGTRANGQAPAESAQSAFDRWAQEDATAPGEGSASSTPRRAIISQTPDGRTVVTVQEAPAADEQQSSQDDAGNSGGGDTGGDVPGE